MRSSKRGRREFVFLLTSAVFIFSLIVQSVSAQCGSSSSTNLTVNNGNYGITFEITALKPLQPCRLSIEAATGSVGTTTIEVWVHPNGLPWARAASPTNFNDGLWVKVGSALVTLSTSSYTQVPIDLSSIGLLDSNQKLGFAVVSDSGATLNGYQTGAGTYIIADANLSYDTQCWGLTGSTSGTTTNWTPGNFPRQFCGTLSYSLLSECSNSLSNGLTPNNGNNGITFEITALKNTKFCEINAVSSTVNSGETIELWTHPNGLPWPRAANPTNFQDGLWVKVGTATNINTPVSGNYLIPIDLSPIGVLSAGQKLGIAIFSTTLIDYRTGSTPYIFSDSNLSFDTQCWGLSGTTMTSSTPGNFPRQFCGSVTYTPVTPPAAPTLVSPANGALNQLPAPVLSWSSVAAATSYTVQVSTGTAFSTTVFQATTSTTSASANGLATGTSYYWRANDGNTSNGNSAWSSVWSFTTASPAGVPLLSSPANNATGQPISGLTLSWASGSGGHVSSYQVQVSTDIFTSTILNFSGITGTSQVLGTLAGSTNHYWRVNATGLVGSPSSWSSIWVFTTNPSLPAAPALSTPSNNSVLSIGKNDSLTFSWGTSATATSYTLQMSLVSNFATTIANQTGLTVTRKGLRGFSGSSFYYWRVNAANVSGSGTWSTVWVFALSVGTLPPESAVAKAPSCSFNNGVLRYSLPKEAAVEISIYDILGKNAYSVKRKESAGNHAVHLVSCLSSGKYIIRMKTAGFERRLAVIVAK